MKYIEVNPSQLVIQGLYAWPLPKNIEQAQKKLEELLFNLKLFLKDKGYSCAESPILFITKKRFGELEFKLSDPYNLYAEDFSFLEKFFILIGKRQEMFKRRYFRKLRITRPEIPWKVLIFWSVGEDLKSRTFNVILKIVVYPAAYYKMRQKIIAPLISVQDYDAILLEGKMFIRSIAKALHLRELEEPRPANKSLPNPDITFRLQKKGFNKTAALIKRSKEKIEKGLFEDGLTDLRTALETFAKELMRDCNLHIKDIPQTLTKAGYLTTSSGRFVENIIKNIYNNLSAAVHGRPEFKWDFFDCLYAYDILLRTLDLLLSKIDFYGVDHLKHSAKGSKGERNADRSEHSGEEDR